MRCIGSQFSAGASRCPAWMVARGSTLPANDGGARFALRRSEPASGTSGGEQVTIDDRSHPSSLCASEGSMYRSRRQDFRRRTASFLAQLRQSSGSAAAVGEVEVVSPEPPPVDHGIALQAGTHGRAKTLSGVRWAARCSCGEAGGPKVVRWVRADGREAVLLATCQTCGSTQVMARREEATLCSNCDRLLDAGDAKCCAANHDVLCEACARQAFPIPGPDWI
jgi:hypothetical protein